MATTYAIISVSGKQYRVREGERLLVDRLGTAEGKTFQPEVLLVGDGAATALGANGVTVTARVVGHVLGKKIRIGKYRPKSGYRRHNGHRSRLSQIEIESIGAKKAAPKKEATPAAKKEAAPSVASRSKPAAAAPKAASTAEKKAPARRTRRTTTTKESE
jgi:large subunit ribosomal protein L21